MGGFICHLTHFVLKQLLITSYTNKVVMWGAHGPFLTSWSPLLIPEVRLQSADGSCWGNPSQKRTAHLRSARMMSQHDLEWNQVTGCKMTSFINFYSFIPNKYYLQFLFLFFAHLSLFLAVYFMTLIIFWHICLSLIYGAVPMSWATFQSILLGKWK